MSRHGDTVFEWADGEHRFRLGVGELRRLQEKCDAGPYELLRRLTHGTWRVDDIREAIRLGLEGGRNNTLEDIKDSDVRRLIRDYVDNKPLLESTLVAARILEAALVGAKDEPLPKLDGEERMATPSPEGKSPSEPYTDGDQSSDTPPPKSIECPSGNSVPASAALKRRTPRRRTSSLPPQTNTAT